MAGLKSRPFKTTGSRHELGAVEEGGEEAVALEGWVGGGGRWAGGGSRLAGVREGWAGIG